MNILAIFILWTWGLTPLWVNIVGTILCSLRVLLNFTKALVETIQEHS